MAGGLPTRRRSSSAAGNSTNVAANSGNNPTTPASRSSTRNAPSSAPPATTRAKRRGRGLPTSRSTPGQAESDPDVAASSPTAGTPAPKSEPKSSSKERASSPVPTPGPSASERALRSPRVSPRSTSSSTTTKKGILVATVDGGDSKSGNSKGKPSTMQVTIKLGGKLFIPNDEPLPPSTPSLANIPSRRRSRSITKEEAPDPAHVPSSLPLGHDGNTFYCQVCGGVGDVVCCDGCPHVYHRDCVPKGSSRESLEKDDDPWYCPGCFSSKARAPASGGSSKTATTPASSKKKSSTKKAGKDKMEVADEAEEEEAKQPAKIERVCFECNEKGLDLQQCESCEGWIHFPSCHPDDDDFEEDEEEEDEDDDSPRKPKKVIDPNRILCRICRVEELETASHDSATSSPSVKTRRQAEKEKSAKRKRDGDEEEDGDEEDEDDAASKEDSPDEDEEDDGDDDENVESKANGDDDEQDEDDASNMDVDDVSTQPDDSPSATTASDKKAKKKKGEDEKGLKTTNNESQAIKKRSRPSLPSSKVKANRELEASVSTPTSTKKGSQADKKKKKNKRVGSPEPSARRQDDEESQSSSMAAFASNHGYPRATPAFFFFLNENRLKIERSLSRKHRIFNRLPKGLERNELVAKEGAIWWSKLRESEIRRYMTMSMREFEERVIEWKQEKNIREMLLDDTNVDDDDQTDISLEDEILTYQNHQRLYLGTTVGSKPFKPEPGTNHNRVLLELLQDMRFHPMPMFQANRSEVEYGQMDFDRVTIPYFDVHGPYSTSVGDECLGCTRGWNHYCSVLKRRIPSIEHRAKLQPPLSSLVATRVGLGLKTNQTDGSEDVETEESAKNIPLFTVRDVADTVSAKKLPLVPCEPLADPSGRADDIVQFIEETISMKVPEPPRPDFPGQAKALGSRPLVPRSAASRRAYDTVGGNDDRPVTLNKCGRCRTVISTDTGCIQCRRAQLVINMSKWLHPGEKDASGISSGKDKSPMGTPTSGAINGSPMGHPYKSNLKVHTVMLGRMTLKDGSAEVQNEADLPVANGIVRQRWTPFSILPPHTLASPTPKSKMAIRRPRPEEHHDATMDDVVTSKGPSADVDETSDVPDDASTSSRSKEEVMDLDDDNSSTEPTNSSATGTRPASKRIRSARIAASEAAHTEPLDDDGRQELAIRYKEEADELHKKCLGVACCGILLALMRRDPLLLFASPVTAEGYSTIIKNPIDFGKIRSSVLEEKYGTLGSFVSDCRLLCTNALAYNPPGSIYWKTAKELFDILAIMQRRASNWMNAVKDAHAMAWRRVPRNTKVLAKEGNDDDRSTTGSSDKDIFVEDPFVDLRKTWPEAVEMLEDSDWLKRCIAADFMRTRENETAYYGALAVRRTAAAAEAALAAYPDSGGVYNTVSRRSHIEDEALRRAIDERVAEMTNPVELKDLPSWREESIIRVTRRAQSRRLDGMSSNSTGCARCDEDLSEPGAKRSKTSQLPHLGYKKSRKHEVPRIHESRVNLSTGMASKTTRDRIHGVLQEIYKEKELHLRARAANEVAVSVKGSGIHGWGLFADQSFKKGDVVAEYIGEYVSFAVTEAREKEYQDQRIQDYQFRLDEQLVIDATMRGGHGRYINHNCSPNCIAKIIPGNPPNEDLKRVIIIAQRDIEPREELTYDYQFPLELDLDARIPCNCMSEHCRGFMNWDLPEKGSNQNFRSQKRGANMRDRIRRLGRPLKSDKGDDDDDTE